MQPSSPDDPTDLRPPEERPAVILGDARGSGQRQFTPGTMLGGRYRIVSLIGRGGMGEVYRADDLRLGQAVALKFLTTHGAAPRLFEEVRIGRQVSHPNVCRLHDIAEADGQIFITMEFVDGEDLASLLRRIGRLSPERALTVSRDICAGVAAAHEKGVIHRDLKPANVMIDGRGRARVTDFGLAVAEESVSDSAGTPAYMAPEQLAGEGASVRSDIYSLGLVLYEIFTGRRTFAATSAHDLLERQRRGDFARPSVVTRDVPAAVERVIVRCLEASPEARPESLEEILRELPGGDPLAAAIAAGETPSPAMVAAAAKSGDLRAIVAWPLLAIAIGGLAAGAVLAERTLLYRQGDVKPPEVLRERALSILASAGVNDLPRDWDFILGQLENKRLSVVYRQSRSPMRTLNADGRLTAQDPPFDRGMASVAMDADGTLIGFSVAPPNVEPAPPHREPDWSPFIGAAGFDQRLLVAVPPEWSAPVDNDSKAAWKAPNGQRIEAAAYHGRPVWFTVLFADSYKVATQPGERTLADRLAHAMFVVFMISLPMAALFVARRNLHRGQGDRRGAIRTATFFFIVMFIGLVTHAHHPMNFEIEWIATSWHVAQATFWALITAVMYIALEPFVRRRWPDMLISWTRLISGRVTDPMVGRDLLMGAAAAAIVSLLWHATLLVSGERAVGAASSLGPARQVVYSMAYSTAEALLRGVGLVVLLVLLRAVVRNDVVASVLTAAMIATMTLGDTAGPFGLRAVYALVAALTAVMLARHFGLLAVMAYALFLLAPRRVPLTLDPDSWYFARSAIVLLLFAALAGYAFRISLGSKRWLPRVALD